MTHATLFHSPRLAFVASNLFAQSLTLYFYICLSVFLTLFALFFFLFALSLTRLTHAQVLVLLDLLDTFQHFTPAFERALLKSAAAGENSHIRFALYACAM
jgi:hypothetical protein